jgi:ABC-type multidrug transport system ATPase subunit
VEVVRPRCASLEQWVLVLTVTNVEVRAGARLLLSPVSFPVNPGDTIGLVGRNGAGKTTLTKILAGEGLPASGSVSRNGSIGYLPQDPRTGDLDITTRDRILSARGLDGVLIRLERYSEQMATADTDEEREKAMSAYSRAENELMASGGYAAESEAARIAANLGLPDRVMTQHLRTLSGGQRRRVELARILFGGADTLLLDEPTNHLDMRAKDVLLTALQEYHGTVVFVSHDRYFIDKLATRVVEVEDGRIHVYPGNYEDYLWRKQGGGSAPISPADSPVAPPPAPVDAPAPAEPARTAATRLNPIKLRQMKERSHAIEDEITRLEVEIADYEAALGNFVNVEETRRVHELLAARRADLEVLMIEWEDVAQSIEANS